MKTIIVILVLIFIFACVAWTKKKEMPYDFEIVPQDRGVVIVNTTSWAGIDFSVTVKSGEDDVYGKILSSSKHCEISGLDNNVPYRILISRSDVLGKLKYKKLQAEVTPGSTKKYIVLVGASVGKSWNLRHLSERSSLPDIFFGYRGIYEFDKTPQIADLIRSPLRPDSVVIKECAAYFPRETDPAMKQLSSWVKQLQQAGIEPILATVVPITHKRSQNAPGVQKSINNFNSAIRDYASKEKLKVLDLQQALSDKSEEGYLSENYAAEDGLHLQGRAYGEKLDELLIELLAL